MTWGDQEFGGDSSSVASQLRSGITYVCATYGAFAATKARAKLLTSCRASCERKTFLKDRRFKEQQKRHVEARQFISLGGMTCLPTPRWMDLLWFGVTRATAAMTPKSDPC